MFKNNGLGFFCATALLAGSALAQSAFPQKSIRIISAFPPGGFSDTAARIVGQRLTALWNQQVVVEARTGANGVIAGDFTAKSAPDGYTLYMTSPGLVTNPLLYARGARDPLKDFSAVSLVAGIPNLMVVHPSVPARNVKEFVALARSRSQSAPLTQASAGTGSPGHLSGELLQLMTQSKFLHVPYKGSSPALIDLVGGHVDLSFPTISSSAPMVREGKLRALGVTTPRRSPMLPDVPALGETVTGYEVIGWYGLVGPAGLPKDIAVKYASEITRMIATPEIRERLLREGAEPMGGTPEDFSAFIATDQLKWTKVIKASGIKPQE
jgi:tripartite-type tricarboxylate transporter receptor subunit TctC